MTIDIRAIERDELARYLETTEAAFAETISEHQVARYARITEPERMLLASEDEVMVGTNGAFRFSITIPGGELPAAGVTMVGVLPSHRRRGVLTGLMRRQFEDLHAWGEPLAVLWASESSIYGRFGYGPATRQVAIDIERDRARFKDDPGPVGRVRMISRDDALKALPEVYERVRPTIPGLLARSPEWWDAHRLGEDPDSKRVPMWRVLLEIEGRAEAYALYRVHEVDWGLDGLAGDRLEVVEAIATTPVATREMWRFLFDLDLVGVIQTPIGEPADTPLWHMMREARRLRAHLGDALWLRVVDVKAALEARSYASEDSLVFELSDDFCPWNAGVWRLEAHRDGARVTPTTEAPDLRVVASDLGSTYLGGTTFGELGRAGVIEEVSKGAAWRADSLFRTERQPWCPEIF